MNYTEKYHLPQWEESDRVMRTDFNQMCADLEAGITRAQETGDTALAHKNYVTGFYIGDGEIQHITLGFRPSFIIISGQFHIRSGDITQYAGRFAFTDGENFPNRLSFTDDGFTVYPRGDEYGYYPLLDETGRRYSYIAFR